MSGRPSVTVATRTYKEIPRPVVAKKYDSLNIPSTHPLDGHPILEFKTGYSAVNIYPLTTNIYPDQERMEVRVAKFLPSLKSDIDTVDWNRVTTERGINSYSIDELTEMARRFGLVVPSKLIKEDIVNLLWDYKERQEKKKR